MTPEPTLGELQRWVASRIRSHADIPLGDPSVINAQRGTPGVERLDVYAGGYLTRTHDALAQMYEAVRHMLGARQFTQLAHRYAEHTTSHTYNLNLRGQTLPEFLTTDASITQLPFLADLARLERMVAHAFHAFDSRPLDPTAFNDLSLEAWQTMRLVFQPSVGLVSSSWPILDLWQARTKPRAQVDVDVVNRPQHVLVFRQGLSVHCQLMQSAQGLLLEHLLAGVSLGDACHVLAGQTEGTAFPLTDWFIQWRAWGVIAGLNRV